MFKNLLLIVSLAVSTAFSYKDVSADTLQAWISSGTKFNFILLDVRDEAELSGVIGSDACRPYHMSWNDNILIDSISLLPKNVVLVVYCASGVRGARASGFLDTAGYTAYNLTGGYNGWTGGTMQSFILHPLSDLPEPSRTAHPDFNGYTDISSETLSSWITAGPPFDFLLIDIRDTSELESIIASDTVRPYHMSWNESVLADSAHLLPIDVAVVLYCRSGGRSAQASALLSGRGFVIYNLLGGFSGWDGPTMAGESIAPLDQMPAPTMRTGASGTLPHSRLHSRQFPVSSTYIAGSLLVEWNQAPLARQHVLVLFTANGKSVCLMRNPFKDARTVQIPPGPPGRLLPVMKVTGN